jgi:hypothetical protein
MRRRVSIAILSALLLVLVGACKSGPPAISDVKMSKTEDGAQPATTFDARDTLYAKASLDNAPKGGKVVGRLIVVNVPGQEAGPIPSLETALDLGAIENTANFTFTAPTAGWPNGQYQLEVVLFDETGAEAAKKTADFTTAGNAPAMAEEPPAEDAATATAEEGTEGETGT